MENATTSLIVLKALAGNKPTGLNAIQEILAPHLSALTFFWISVWIVTAVVILLHCMKEYRKQRDEHEKRKDL